MGTRVIGKRSGVGLRTAMPAYDDLNPPLIRMLK